MSNITDKTNPPKDIVTVSIMDLRNPKHKDVYNKLLKDKKTNAKSDNNSK